MAKKKTVEVYTPTIEEIESAIECWNKNIAYTLLALKNGKFNIIKYVISDYKNVVKYKENNKVIEFTQQEGTKKIMQLYVNQKKYLK